jgi:lipoprotein NlpI
MILTPEQKAKLAHKVELANTSQLLKKLNLTKEERLVRLARASMLRKLIKEK